MKTGTPVIEQQLKWGQLEYEVNLVSSSQFAGKLFKKYVEKMVCCDHVGVQSPGVGDLSWKSLQLFSQRRTVWGNILPNYCVSSNDRKIWRRRLEA